MGFIRLYMVFIAISFLVSLTVYFRPIASYFYLKLFPPFLLATLIVEALGSYLYSIGKNNLALYNFFTVFEFLFYLYFISFVISNKRIKLIIRVTAMLYVLVAITNIIFIQGMKIFHTMTYSLGCLIIVVFCIYYFLELFRQSRSIKLLNSPPFWIFSGLLFFYCCGFPLYGLINYWSGISKLLVRNFDEIFTILNIFLYTLFTVAFLCIKTRKYILSPS